MFMKKIPNTLINIPLAARSNDGVRRACFRIEESIFPIEFEKYQSLLPPAGL
jgi:hypothetical protein